MAKNQNEVLKKLMKPKTSAEAETFFEELSTMLESVREEFNSLTQTKEDVLSSLDDKKIDLFFDQERELDKKTQVLEYSEQRLQKTLDELKVQEGKLSAKPIRDKAIQAQQRGVDIYSEYTKHAKAIKSLIDELTQANKQIVLANLQCSQLDQDHCPITLPVDEFGRLNNIASAVDLSRESRKSAIRLPIAGMGRKYHVNLINPNLS